MMIPECLDLQSVLELLPNSSLMQLFRLSKRHQGKSWTYHLLVLCYFFPLLVFIYTSTDCYRKPENKIERGNTFFYHWLLHIYIYMYIYSWCVLRHIYFMVFWKYLSVKDICKQIELQLPREAFLFIYLFYAADTLLLILSSLIIWFN